MNKYLSIKDIVNCTKGQLIIGNEEYICENFSKDTRTINFGDVYIGIKGESTNGNLMWKQALEKGASAVIVENIDFSNEDIEKYKNKTIVKVKSTIQALADMATFKRSLYNIPVIAITGSAGKTSTKDIVAQVVSTKYKTLKTEGNYNNNIGLPLTILSLKEHEALVIEMGMNHLGEISLLSQIAKPTICIITNIGTSHIGFLGSRENILKAKLEILDGMEKPIVVINMDNDLLSNWYEQNKNKYEIYTYGSNNNNTAIMSNIQINEKNTVFDCEMAGIKTTITVPVGGKHFAYNALPAILIGDLFKINIEDIKKSIAQFELTKKRMEISTFNNKVKLIDDTYNASYESMIFAIEHLSKISANKKIAILGDMFELGDFAKQFHENVGIAVAKNKVDILICTRKK